MGRRGYTVSSIHGDTGREERDAVMRGFRAPSASPCVLITSDLLAVNDGLWQHASVVINYDLPSNRENYLYRVGRSDSGSRKGVAINFLTNRDVRYLRDIEKYYDTQVNELPMDMAGLI